MRGRFQGSVFRDRSSGRDILRHVPFLSVGEATSSMSNHSLRLHGRDDHAPLFARQRELKTYKLKT